MTAKKPKSISPKCMPAPCSITPSPPPLARTFRLGAPEFWDRRFTGGKPDPSRDLDLQAGYPRAYFHFSANMIAANLTRAVVPFPATSAMAADFLAARKVRVDFVHIDAAHEYDDGAVPGLGGGVRGWGASLWMPAHPVCWHAFMIDACVPTVLLHANHPHLFCAPQCAKIYISGSRFCPLAEFYWATITSRATGPASSRRSMNLWPR